MINLRLFLLLTGLVCMSNTIVYAQRGQIKTIVIDPGHGGFDPGAKGSYSTEAAVALSVSLLFGKKLEAAFPDKKIVYTRTTDVIAGNTSTKDESLRYRAQVANEVGGNLFISIHCNAAGKAPGGWNERRVSHYETKTRKVKGKTRTTKVPVYTSVWVENKARGTETYIWAANKIDAKVNAMNRNSEVHEEIDSTSTLKLPDPKDAAEKARMLFYTEHFFKKSLDLAMAVEEEFTKAGRVSRGVKQRDHTGIWVLQATGMPSVLIEIGFVSNKEEEDYLNSPGGQNEIAENILSAVKSYIEKFEVKKPAENTGDKKPF